MIAKLASVRECNGFIEAKGHYLGPTRNAAFGWRDERGAMLFSRPPRARGLPPDLVELVRWALRGEKNDGSRQWSDFVRWARVGLQATTVVSYSDPARGHTGALYRACNWWWAPTWHRLRPPPTGNGSWNGEDLEGVKDRWTFALRPDDRRASVLAVNDAAVVREMPWASYREPGGGDYKRFAKMMEERNGGRQGVADRELAAGRVHGRMPG